jgi:hypothetical protein
MIDWVYGPYMVYNEILHPKENKLVRCYVSLQVIGNANICTLFCVIGRL